MPVTRLRECWNSSIYLLSRFQKKKKPKFPLASTKNYRSQLKREENTCFFQSLRIHFRRRSRYSSLFHMRKRTAFSRWTSYRVFTCFIVSQACHDFLFLVVVGVAMRTIIDIFLFLVYIFFFFTTFRVRVWVFILAVISNAWGKKSSFTGLIKWKKPRTP